MKNFVLIGDVHSQYHKLESALNWIQDNVSNFHIIFLGDLFDSRNEISNSCEVYQAVRKLESENLASTLQSNHQYKLLRYLRGNRVVVNHGLDITLQDFSLEKSHEIRDWLETLPYGVVFRNSEGLEYRAAHAYFSASIEVPETYDEIHCVSNLSRKYRDLAIYGPSIPGPEFSRICWWEKESNRDWIRVAGHYHVLCENYENRCLVLDAGCGTVDGKLAIYNVNQKQMLQF